MRRSTEAKSKLPDGVGLIPGVINTLTSNVEHPRLIAPRLETCANIVCKENVVAGADCGFGNSSAVGGFDRNAAWLKLKSLSEGTAMASDKLWGRRH